MVKAQESGDLGYLRTTRALTNVPSAVANFGLYTYETIGNALIDAKNTIASKLYEDSVQTGKIPSRHVDYVSETLSKIGGFKSTDADLILEWSPDVLDKITDAGIEGATVALPFQAIKVGSYFYRDKSFRNYVKQQFGKKGGTFD